VDGIGRNLLSVILQIVRRIGLWEDTRIREIQNKKQGCQPFNHARFHFSHIKDKSKSHYERRSVGQSVMVGNFIAIILVKQFIPMLIYPRTEYFDVKSVNMFYKNHRYTFYMPIQKDSLTIDTLI
jgi:hypothetical protein